MNLCDCCFHPVLDGMNCPFCDVTIQTKRCETCESIMFAIPTSDDPKENILVCQTCAMEGRKQPSMLKQS